jgi:hypothetical protein
LSISDLNVRLLTMFVWAVIGIQIVRSDRLPGRILIYMLPPIALVALSVGYQASVPSAAAASAATFRSLLIFAISLAVLAYMLIRDGEVSAVHLADAIVVGVTITGVIFLVQNDFQPWAYTTRAFEEALQPGLLGYRTHYGYLVCIGFCISVARALPPRGGASRPAWALPVAGFLGSMTIFSLTRGAWLAAAVYLIVLPFRTGYRSVWLVLAVVSAIAFSFPLVQERLLSDVSGGVTEAIQSGDFATGRAGLWGELGERVEVGGRGFGYMFSLTPREVLGVTAFTSGRNAFVYPHNDFLYAALDFGLVGVILLVLLWIGAVSAYRRSRPAGGWLFGGVILTMFVASMVDNGIFIRPLLERSLVVMGALVALAAAPREPATDGLRSDSE